MKIAVASDDGVSISAHFGRCAGFVIFAAEGADIVKCDYRTNTFGHHQELDKGHEHGESHHSHEGFLSALNDCQVVICHGMGRRAVADLKANGIQVAITAEALDATSAAKLFAQGRLAATDESSCCSHK
jgi:predicted Fe-Mo cluster-binding NifX family protein